LDGGFFITINLIVTAVKFFLPNQGVHSWLGCTPQGVPMSKILYVYDDEGAFASATVSDFETEQEAAVSIID
jgi:hypothetical protein